MKNSLMFFGLILMGPMSATAADYCGHVSAVVADEKGTSVYISRESSQIGGIVSKENEAQIVAIALTSLQNKNLLVCTDDFNVKHIETASFAITSLRISQ